MTAPSTNPLGLPAVAQPEWAEAFARVLAPVTTGAADRLVAALASVPGVDVVSVRSGFVAQTARKLVRMATSVLVDELRQCRARGDLTGADSVARFADFVHRHTDQAVFAGVLTRYPVLARLLDEECARRVDSLVELLVRFATDRRRVVAELLGGVDPGDVRGVRTGLGDPHQGGRTTGVMLFADGARIVHKPRGVEPQLRFAEFVDLLNDALPDLGLATVAAVSAGGHGWSRFVEADPLPDATGAHTFHRRLGALLALLTVLRATDIHYGNLIACGDQPMLVDLETLWHPRHPRFAGQAETDDPAAVALAESVLRTALPPTVAIGPGGVLDISGMGGDAGQPTPNDVLDWADAGTDRMRPVRGPGRFGGAANRPVLDGRPLDAADHAPAVLAGFRQAYDAITGRRDDFAGALRRCADTVVRYVPVPTRQYAALLSASRTPECMRESRAHTRALTPIGGHPRLTRYEVADLGAGDIPLFHARAGGRDVWTADGTPVPGLLDRSGLEDALDRLAGMDELDRRDQEWTIAAALAGRRPVRAHPVPAVDPAATATAASTDQLLAAACSVGDQVVAAVLDSATGRRRVNWLGIELVDDARWLVLPMGAGLATGYTGVALFLAQLSVVSGVTRYLDVASRALTGVPDLLAGLGSRPDLVAAVGCGGLNGFGGIGYALARLSTLLGDPELERCARIAVDLAGDALGDEPGWADGLAGCAAALTAIDTEIGSGSAGQIAAECVTRLTSVPPVDTPGFAAGSAGVRRAVAIVTGTDPGGDAAPGSVPATGAGWCCGPVLARADPVSAAAALADRPLPADLCLRHGELGVVDVLAAGNPTGSGPVTSALRQRAGLVLDALRRNGPRCATPDSVSTPGLLDGLAGIGYGLLRLGFADRVPSVLALAPTPG